MCVAVYPLVSLVCALNAQCSTVRLFLKWMCLKCYGRMSRDRNKDTHCWACIEVTAL